MKIKINVVNDNEETSIKDNDLTEYRNSIKPNTYAGNPDIFKEPRAIGQPVHPGDVLLVKVKDKLFKCEIIDNGVFRKLLGLFEVHIYPLDKDDKELLANDIINRNILKRNYMDGTLVFDKDVKKDDDNNPYYEVDYTKGEFDLVAPSVALNAYEEELSEQPFTVVKFLTRSVPASTIQDHNLDLTYISQDLKIFIKQCLEFKELLEEHREAIEECIKDDQRSVELDGYDGEDPVESPNKKYLEMITFCIDDVEYNIDELIDQIKKR